MGSEGLPRYAGGSVRVILFPNINTNTFTALNNVSITIIITIIFIKNFSITNTFINRLKLLLQIQLILFFSITVIISTTGVYFYVLSNDNKTKKS